MIPEFTTKTLRRLLQKIRHGVSGPAVAAMPYRPRFEGEALLARFQDIPPETRTRGDFEYEGALAARKAFPSRLFVEPQAIPALMQDASTLYPEALATLRRRAEEDIQDGIQIYSTRGPRLGGTFPWKDLPRGPGGDALYPLRPHRFAFAPRHALASLCDPQAAAHLRGMLESWMHHAQNGEDKFCYDSNLVVIQRMLALTWTWIFLAARPAEKTETGLGLEWLILKIIEADIRFLEPRLGDSAPNNHLLADRFAHWYITLIFPEFLQEAETGAEEQWVSELLAQTYPDGGSFEHSSHYHEFACEMGAAYLLLSKRNNRQPSDIAAQRVKALLDYQCALTGPDACVLPLGNAIEDTLFPLDAGEAWCPGALRELNRALFAPELTAAPRDDPGLIRAFWLLGGRVAACTPGEHYSEPPGDFPDSGLHILHDNQLNARLVLRTGPSPDRRVAPGHMHADILSIYVVADGRPLVVDSGTYTYRRRGAPWQPDAPIWRDYFAGPRAHNGFEVGEEDPLGRMSGDFRSRPCAGRATSTVTSGLALTCVDATWDAPGSAYHGARRTCIHVTGKYWLVLNDLSRCPRNTHETWLNFQFARGCTVQRTPDHLQIKHADDTRAMVIANCGKLGLPQILDGSLAPLGGWVAERYGRIDAAPQVKFSLPADASSAALLLTSSIEYQHVRLLESQCFGDGSWFLHIAAGDMEDWVVLQKKPSQAAAGNHLPCAFDGQLLWLRSENGRLVSLKWLQATHLDWPEKELSLRLRGEIPRDLSHEVPSRENNDPEFAQYDWPTATKTRS